jgi:hypothetical protein
MHAFSSTVANRQTSTIQGAGAVASTGRVSSIRTLSIIRIIRGR